MTRTDLRTTEFQISIDVSPTIARYLQIYLFENELVFAFKKLPKLNCHLYHISFYTIDKLFGKQI